jgi:hypothetical protein
MTPCSSSLLALLLALGPAVAAQGPAEGDRPARSDEAARESPLALEARLAAGVSAERAARRVRELCALGARMGGTRSGGRAATYLREAFEQIGLEVRVVTDPPRRCHEETSWSVTATPQGGEPFALASAWPYGFSPGAQGSAALGLEPAAGGAWLASRPPRLRGEDAPALVLVDGATSADGRFPVVRHLRGRAAQEVPHFGLSRSDGERLRALLAARAAVTIDFALEAQIREASPLTVVARLPGRAPRSESWSEDHLLVCAHGDSDAGGPGADDNASGVAAVLEVAQAWSEAVAAGVVPAPQREVRFAIWGSEIHSSRAYLERRGAEDGELLGVINFDQAGFGSGADRVFVEPDDLPANRGMTRTLLAVLGDHAPTGEGAAPGAFPREWASVRSLGGTDSYVFSASPAFRQRGLPSMTVYTSAWGDPAEHARTAGMPGESWSDRDVVAVDHDVYYHSAGDTPENTTDREPWNTAWCARVALLGARRFLEGLEEAR